MAGGAKSAYDMKEVDEMSMEGIWTLEVYGPYSWESHGVLVLENDRITGGDDRQFTSGRYTQSGEKFDAEIDVHYYGPPRTILGENKERFAKILSGKREGSVIAGVVSQRNRPNLDIPTRLTKRRELAY
jgi:hypothetical protein